ncbi:MAG TPA: UDP-N-acetylmuramoyl-tripeptide--D-alanyl-D-alanine ligase [Flavobacteriales bacterium]
MISIPQLHQRASTLNGISTDTRSLPPGCLFFALKGPNFDANAFAAQALEHGAGAVVVDDASVVKDDRYLLVPDTLRALQELARHHRRMFDIPVLAITGTNGKTTTKELVHAVLSADRSTLSTQGNLNNHIGVPLTLLRLGSEHRIAVIEMGANKPGDIAELCAIAEPTHGLITNVGRAHLEGFGDFQGVLRTKTELYDHLRRHRGQVFVNADDALLMARSHGIARTTYGMNSTSDLRGNATGDGPFLAFIFGTASMAPRTVTSRLVGDYNLPNALAAACIGHHFGVPDTIIAQAIAGYAPGNNRSQFNDTGRNHLVLDAYNANPSSMHAALLNFQSMQAARPKLVILGDMLELGGTSEEEHRSIVDQIEQLGLDAILVGPIFQSTPGASAAKRFGDAKTALSALEAERPEGKLILVKGSRGIRLETLVPAL